MTPPDRCRLNMLVEAQQPATPWPVKTGASMHTIELFDKKLRRYSRTTMALQATIGIDAVADDYYYFQTSAVGHGKMFLMAAVSGFGPDLIVIDLATGAGTRINDPLGGDKSFDSIVGIIDEGPDTFLIVGSWFGVGGTSGTRLRRWDKASVALLASGESTFTLAANRPSKYGAFLGFANDVFVGGNYHFNQFDLTTLEFTGVVADGVSSPFSFAAGGVTTFFRNPADFSATLYGISGSELRKAIFWYDTETESYIPDGPYTAVNLRDLYAGLNIAEDIFPYALDHDGTHLYIHSDNAFNSPNQASILKVDPQTYAIQAYTPFPTTYTRGGVFAVEW